RVRGSHMRGAVIFGDVATATTTPWRTPSKKSRCNFKRQSGVRVRSETPGPRRRYYGIAEIADALGVDRQLVTVWRRRSSHGMPDPDEELSSGPVWDGVRVEQWIAATRTRLDQERA